MNADVIATLKHRPLIYIDNVEYIRMLIANLNDVDCANYHLSYIAGLDPYWGAMVLRKRSPWLARMNFEVTYRMAHLEHVDTMRNQSLCVHRLIHNEVQMWVNVSNFRNIFC
jgi:hypothetical protein